ELQKLVDDPDVAVTTELSDTKIRFTIGSVILTSKLIDGTFPDYQRVIPTGNDKKLIIDRQSFAAAVDRVSTISSERGRAVKLSINDGQLTLAVNNPDSGRAQLTGSEAKFMLADAGSPTLIHDMADETALYVLMPMRV
ncbi:MAG: DNA polymerase III subunit beta, partial [Mesorhizobium sp.]